MASPPASPAPHHPPAPLGSAPATAPSSPLSGAELTTGAVLRRLFALSWRYRRGCASLLLLQILLLGTSLVALQLGGIGIDAIRFHLGEQGAPPCWPGGWPLPADWPPSGQVGMVALAILAVALVRAGLNYGYTVAAGVLVHQRIVVDLRAAVYDKLQRLDFRFYDANASGSIINRITSDVQSVRMFVDGVLVQFAILVLSLAGYVAYMLSLHVGLTVACLATTPLLGWLAVRFSRRVRPMYDANRKLVDRMVLSLAENLQGAAVIRGFGREDDEIARFRQHNDSVRDQQRDIFWRVATFSPMAQQLTQINLIVLLLYGGYLVSNNELSLGAGLVVFAGLLQQLASQVAHLSTIANSVQESLTGSRRVFEVLEANVAIQSPPQPRTLERVRGELTFEGVTFAYRPGTPVLHGIDLRIEAGQKVAIVGATGAGKSTLLSLVPRFHDPSAGRVLLDGVDLRELDLDSLRRSIGIVFQESFLFSHTIAANIAFGHPEATRERIERAARIAAADEFIERLPDGYDTVLGEHGLNLSGGQRQRLAIARAVLLDPPILLLDDPAAAIDSRTEREIAESLRSAMRRRTTLIIAHRLATLRDADWVVVLEDGRVAAQGRHEDLLAAPGHYREAALAQMFAGQVPVLVPVQAPVQGESDE